MLASKFMKYCRTLAWPTILALLPSAQALAAKSCAGFLIRDKKNISNFVKSTFANMSFSMHRTYEKKMDDYSIIMVKAIADRYIYLHSLKGGQTETITLTLKTLQLFLKSIPSRKMAFDQIFTSKDMHTYLSKQWLPMSYKRIFDSKSFQGLQRLSQKSSMNAWGGENLEEIVKLIFLTQWKCKRWHWCQ